ncbi:hypothetical protein D3C77_409680 [compost metagenome]
MSGLPLSARETVVWETPATRAISLIVIIEPLYPNRIVIDFILNRIPAKIKHLIICTREKYHWISPLESAILQGDDTAYKGVLQ